MELAIPHLRILDYDEAVSFYVGARGFEIAFEWRHEPGFPVYTLAVADVDGWYGRLKDNGVAFERELQTQPWGARDFVVQDPFDNTIVVTSAG